MGCYSKRNSLIPKVKFLSAIAAAAAFVNQLCKSAFSARGSCSSWAGVDSQHGKSLWGQALNRHTGLRLRLELLCLVKGLMGIAWAPPPVLDLLRGPEQITRLRAIFEINS